MLEWLPEQISTYGGQIDSILYVIYYVVGFWFLLAQGFLIGFVIWYWKRTGENEDVPYVPARRYSVMAVVLIPGAMVLGCDLAIDFWQESAWAHIKEHRPEAEKRVKITAKQFTWKFQYPGPDGEFDTEDDFRTHKELHVPADQNVVFHLTSRDVIHSFWVPTMRLKQDAVPGRTIKGWFNATKPGEYEIMCAELCGIGHGVMDGRLIVHKNDDYEKWRNKQITND
ncbi:MAG: cytochrome c oxidase subunit II [bacterium]